MTEAETGAMRLQGQERPGRPANTGSGERGKEILPPRLQWELSGVSSLTGREQRSVLFGHLAGVCCGSPDKLMACQELTRGSHDLSYPRHPSHPEDSKAKPILATKNRLQEDEQLFSDDIPRMSRGQNFSPRPPWFISSGLHSTCKCTQSE